ncbi:MAG: amidohydrolase [Nocardioides sp.]
MADLVFTNGAVFDGHRYRGRGSIAVRDGRITEVSEPISFTTDQVVDLSGGLLAPGFIDAHVHAAQGGLERRQCDLSDVHTRADYLRVVGEYAAAQPHVPWILGGGWSMAAFAGGTALTADLDAVVPDRPVYLLNRDHHGAWVNSRAFALAGVHAGTPDARDGHFDRDLAGAPSGTLHEGAMDIVGRVLPDTDPAESYAGLLEGQRYLHSLGVTGWQDAILGAYGGHADPAPTYLRAAERGDLTADVVGALWWDRDRGLEQIDEIVERRTRFTQGRLRATSVKIMYDGIAENFTAAMTGAYLDRCGHATSNDGHSFLTPGALTDAVVALAARDFQVHVHAIGDRAVRETLDAFSAAGRPDLRPHVAHLQVIHPDDVPRFAQLGVTANLQALWACLDDQMVDLTLPFLGEELARWQYPFGDLHRAGATLCAGSDWPVSTPDPLAALHVAVNRTAYDEPGRAGSEPFLPEQALDLATAWAAYTSGSARINGLDTRGGAGVLAPGAVADLVVLDRDPFAGPSSEIGAARVVSTWVSGVPVFEA